MSLQTSRASNRQIVRVLQICLVLEEVVEARARKQATGSAGIDGKVRPFLEDVAVESARHRNRMADLVESTDADAVPFDDVERLVEEQFEADEDFENVLYDQLCYAETTYKLYDDLILTLEEPDTEFGAEHGDIISVLGEVRTEKAFRIRRLLELMADETESDTR